ncbi:hypothetical protein ILUMI_07712 [Ignelater luminosus]|uniref:Ribosomal protein 63, mitochondrial n=1 Tax=Ignelater luminosus TaxID=2038154 RepID=A0A8K0DCX0_IGNLU|nr:hypothetical protein ILUMI_07712 [Ignelater luminosus]
MRLFQTLFRRKHMPNGHIYRGKDRIVKPVTKEDLAKLRLDFEIEERNMFYLRHPYLTREQSHGHTKVLGRQEANYIKLLREKNKDYYDNVTVESRLGHLRYKEAWD